MFQTVRICSNLCSDAGYPVNRSRYLINALNACASCQGRAGALPLSSAMFKKESFDDCLLKASRGQAGMALHTLYKSMQNNMKELHILLGARRFMPFVELAQHVYAGLEAYELKNGIVAASQIPRLAKTAVDGSEGVNELICRFGTRITHILIDEFQDTSLDQWLALQPLAMEALSRNGSLTIVGDVKQAIYGWRGGDARLFDQLVSQGSELLPLVDSPLLETLPFNWRSRRNIVSWNNALFSALASPDTARDILFPLAENDEDLLHEEAALLAGAFQGASQSAEHCPEGGSVCLYPLEKGQEDDIASLLPGMVENMGKSRPWGDICILVRNNEQAAKTASWLMARHIPVVTQGSLLLAEQPVIAALIHLLRFINSPDDDIAFFSLLSSEELLPPLPSSHERPSWHDWLAARSREKSIARQFAADFPEEWNTLFSSLHDNASLLTPYDTVMEVLKRWHVTERRPAEEGFIRRFLEVLFCAEEQGISDISGFLDFWDKSGRQEKAPLPESMNAVSIMTMHKAKGLEFDTVILPYLSFPLGRNTEEKAVFWKSRGIGLLAPLCKDMGRPWLKDRMDTARESMHLIYVAMTRAVSELHCFLPSAEDGPIAAMLNALVSRMGSTLKNQNGVLLWGEENIAPHHAESTSPSLLVPWQEDAPSVSIAPASEEEDEKNWRPMSWV
ncbi:MAG: UvrD-helicase domain-containing protein, partial [Mailhella sp.]